MIGFFVVMDPESPCSDSIARPGMCRLRDDPIRVRHGRRCLLGGCQCRSNDSSPRGLRLGAKNGSPLRPFTLLGTRGLAIQHLSSAYVPTGTRLATLRSDSNARPPLPVEVDADIQRSCGRKRAIVL
ncbi:hypothetical protein IE81DRAFT_18472 [Ceraceosorus guamensis]|uniref:Uncharacterized protein n=1 Tax=Ceraceosorus guamensis TaxID=1522189 RepID=A0A316W3L0_9BASI|nr:hypothetical protein IE81DRAFT_18472 [Ceraceosorus guamensis]PWN44380.1 hypothetical protein IE81DRAFT_18472 [Ceraceosorus guamensis]